MSPRKRADRNFAGIAGMPNSARAIHPAIPVLAIRHQATIMPTKNGLNRTRNRGGSKMSWIDRIKKERDSGLIRPLLQSEHAEVNTRYPGCTLEYCCACDRPTGNAGKGEDSNYTDDDKGPFCWECFPGKEDI